MISFGSLVRFAANFDARNATEHGSRMYEELVYDAVLEAWNDGEWPFHIAQGDDEGCVTLRPTFSIGSLTVTNGSTTIQFSSSASQHADWLGANWNFPASLYTGQSQENYLVTSISASVGVLDHPYAGDTASGQPYTLGFTAYDLPIDFGAMHGPVVANDFVELRYHPYDEFVRLRVDGVWDGESDFYSVLPSDGRVGARLFVWPPPSATELLRFVYRRLPPRMNIYDEGTASVASANAEMATGVSTAFSTMGWNPAGSILEFHEDARGVRQRIARNSGDTELYFEGAWTGPALSSKNYMLSTDTRMPDYMLAALHDKCKVKVCELRRDYVGMGLFEQKYRKSLGSARSRAWPYDAPICKRDVQLEDTEHHDSPRVPRMVINNNQ